MQTIFMYVETVNTVSNIDQFDSDRIRYWANLSVGTKSWFG